VEAGADTNVAMQVVKIEIPDSGRHLDFAEAHGHVEYWGGGPAELTPQQQAVSVGEPVRVVTGKRVPSADVRQHEIGDCLVAFGLCDVGAALKRKDPVLMKNGKELPRIQFRTVETVSSVR